MSIHAQQTGKIFRIGFLDSSTASGSAVLVEAFRQELNKLGWIEGKNVTIEYRFAEGKRSPLPDLSADLVRLKVDLIVASGTPEALAAKSATTTIPIVMVNPGNPVGAGLVTNLARPGGNVTGNSGLIELNTKRLEILKDALPSLTRVGVLLTSANRQLKEIRGCGSSPETKIGGNRDSTQRQRVGGTFHAAKQKQVGAMMITTIWIFFAERKPIELAGKYRLPAVSHKRVLSMRVVSCPTGQTPLTFIGARLFMWTRS